MASRSKRIRHDLDAVESMDVDADGVFSENHQLMLQYLLHARMVKKSEIGLVNEKLFSDKGLNDTLYELTKKINPLKMDIKRVTCDVTGVVYYVLIHTTGETFTRCSIFNKSQLEFLKQILTGIVLSSDGQIGKIQALNSSKVLSKTEADETFGQFIKEKILIKANTGGFCLSPLSIVEFEPFFQVFFPDNLFNCELCKQLVFVGKICNGCEQRFHFHCVSKWQDSNRNECPNCQVNWNSNTE